MCRSVPNLYYLPLTSVRAADCVDLLKTALGDDRVHIVADERANGIILSAATQAKYEQAKQILDSLDQQGGARREHR